MDSFLYVTISQSSFSIFAPQGLEKTLNNIFGEIVVKKPLTKKEMRKHYEDYRVRSLKNKKKINQIVTYAEYSNHKKKNFKVWRGLEDTYRKDWKYSYKTACILYSLISYIILIKFINWLVKLLGG
tara:strand:+ start:547 stop:924 length:378 start_codon:yes stop_codon:yes gene_type:complete